MGLQLTNTTLSGTVDATEINENFADIVDKFSENITNKDISDSAGIEITKLNAFKTEIYVTLSYVYDGATTFSGGTDGDIYGAAVPMPGESGDDFWTVADASWACQGTGTVAATFNVELGDYDGTGAWASDAELIAEESITVSTNEGNQGGCTIDSSAITHGSAKRFLVLTRGATAGTNVINAAGDYLSVTLRLTRNIQAS